MVQVQRNPQGGAERTPAPSLVEAAAAEPAKQTVAAEEAAAAKASEEKTPPEVQPLPPKKEFQYGDDLTLD